MPDLSNQSLWLISVSVFFAGVIGSPHCLSMCGPIVINFSRRSLHLAFYQLGRMLSYVLAGAILGGFGDSLLGQNRPIWISQLALAAIAVLLLYNGLRAITDRSLIPDRATHFVLPLWLRKPVQKLWIFARSPLLPRPVAAGLAGFFTVFLPCGHLYGFLLGAAITGSALSGAVFMFAFWLGSAPLLSASGGIFQKLMSTRMGKNRRRLAGVLLVAGGLLSVAAFGTRIQGGSEERALEVQASGAPRCH